MARDIAFLSKGRTLFECCVLHPWRVSGIVLDFFLHQSWQHHVGLFLLRHPHKVCSTCMCTCGGIQSSPHPVWLEVWGVPCYLETFMCILRRILRSTDDLSLASSNTELLATTNADIFTRDCRMCKQSTWTCWILPPSLWAWICSAIMPTVPSNEWCQKISI